MNGICLPTRGEWQQLLDDAIVTPRVLARRLGLDHAVLEAVAQQFPLRINPYYLSLIQGPGDPIWRQCIPDPAELADPDGFADPLAEDPLETTDHLIHRYPDRALLLVHQQCAVNCRFCMRRRRVGRSATKPSNRWDAALGHIAATAAIREVILSGGDPLLLSTDHLAGLLARVRAIEHVEIIRIHTRVPCTLPQRITDRLAQMLRGFHPLYVNTHFNHPMELTPQAAKACATLADAGIPLGCQTVLLKGINDDVETLRRLMRGLLRMRVKPYYLHHPDPVRGTGHFRLAPDRGVVLMKALRGHVSGMAVPHYVVDLPGGGGKVPLTPDYVIRREPGRWVLHNYQGGCYDYPADGC